MRTFKMLRAVIKLSYCNMLQIRPQCQVTKLQQIMAPSFFLHSRASFRTDDDDERNLPRITCPAKLKDQYEHRLKKYRSGKGNPLSRGRLIIACKRKIYNCRRNDKFDKFNIQKLASCGWKNKKNAGDHFTLVPHSKNPSLQSEDDTLSFQELGINENLCTGLQNLGFEHPTEIQKRAIPSLLRGDNAICAAETGSGKTLAYLLPAVEWILRLKHANEQSPKTDESNHVSNIYNPNTVIVTPNRELAHQIMGVAETLTPYADFVPCCLTGGNSRMKLSAPMDMLITTSGALIKHLFTNRIKRTNLQHLIIDESDTMLDDSFISDLHKIFKQLQVSPVEVVDSTMPYLSGTQIVLCSATMPKNVDEALEKFLRVDLMNRITTKGLHKLQPHVPQMFVRMKPSEKPEKLIQLVKEKKHLTTLIFANSSKTCYFLSKILEDNGVQCLRLTGELNPEDRAGIFNKFKEGYSDVLVATDIISRGMDTTNVQHVINYDFPTFMSDYIHRVGRVGRVGGKEVGRVTSFVSHKFDVELLWKIESAARSNKTLGSVNANIKKMLNAKLPDDFDSEV